MRRLLLLSGILSLIALTSCEHEEHHQHGETKFPVTSPVIMDTSMTKEYVAQIHSYQHIELRTQERGYLEKILVDEGDRVKKGQLLFQIMPRLYNAELQKAKAEANYAEIEYLNTKRLADSNVVAPNELALAKAEYEKAKAALSLAEVHMQFTEIRAPFSGIIDRFHVRLGSLLDEGELLTSLSDNSKMWVYFNVPEAEYLNLMSLPNKDSLFHVQLRMANDKLFKHKGVVETIEADFNNETGNIPFRATFPNPRGLLRHGETGNILLTEPLIDALIIPQKATFEILDKKFVFVIDEDNTVRTQEIVVQAEMEDLYAVKRGLKETDKILLEGLRKVRDGNKIEVDFKKPEKVISSLKLYAE